MFYAVLGLSIFFFVGITFFVVYFTIKYRHRPGHKAQPSPAHNDAMEITWTVIPTIICVFLFLGGWKGYLEFTSEKSNPMVIDVTAQKWHWNFTYPDGTQDGNLHVPVGQPIRMRMTSVDVLHSFYVPAFRVKQDVVPRRYTYVQFTPTRPGVYRLYCAEYCGDDHSQMKVKVFVHEAGGYERFLSEKASLSQSMSPEETGLYVYNKKGCVACHSVDGSPKVGPSWKGIWNEQVKLADGTTITVDDQYIKDSVLEPQKQARPGYPPSMPSFAGQLSEREIAGVIAYIKSLK
ncbi:MAG: cytochrome c oxidase subunit II [Kofleriaceae bacterium]|nr:cytochrome c oxidase subunit II [Kofleriaceae bacterium]